jgi:23S rRNA pseudouridine1911/1915/1917 synthase
MDVNIIYLDEDIIVVNKPAGIPVHGGLRVRGKTLVDFLLEEFPEIAKVGDDSTVRPGIVHRLDKDTSGVMIVARNQKSFEALKELFKTRKVEKTYLAVVCGKVKERKGVISLSIGRLVKNPLKRGIVESYAMKPRKFVRGEREAITEYKVLKTGNIFSLIELRPKTGRMHQLRVHLKAIGHPVACDKIYGGESVCCPEGVNRQLLHSKSLSFSYPAGRKFYFEADPPEDFSNAIKILDSV